MKCLDCGNEMQQGIVEGYGQGGHSCSDIPVMNLHLMKKKRRRGWKGFLLKKLLVSLQTIWSIVHGIVQSVKKF